MPVPTICEVLGRCYVGPDHYEWPRAGSGQRIDQMQLLQALRDAFDPNDRFWPNRVMARPMARLQPEAQDNPGPMRPGDVWQHHNMGRLYVTGEDTGGHPDYLRCYWGMGGNPRGLGGLIDPQRTEGFRLVSRMVPDPAPPAPTPAPG